MITLARRPTPQIGTTKSTWKPVSEAAYAVLMAAQAAKERQLRKRSYLTDSDYIDALTGCDKTTMQLAYILESDPETVRSRMFALERGGMVCRVGSKWSLA